MKNKVTSLVIAMTLCATQLINASIIYVDVNAIGTNNGTDWNNAYTSLNSALTSASSGDSILVAKGIYIPHASDRTEYFNLVDGVVLIGGFEGSESDFSQSTLDNRDFILNETVLSGDLNGDDDNFSNNSENSYHVIYANMTSSSLTSATVIDGFTISGGNANYYSYPEYDHLRGGGVFLEADGAWNCNPTFRNILVKENTAQFGGGISIVAQNTGAICNPTFENFIVENNRTFESDPGQVSAAAGILINTINGESSPVFNNGAIKRNIVVEATYKGTGGGVDISASLISGTSESSPVFNDVLFCGNLASGGGAQIHTYAQNGGTTVAPIFTNITIAGGVNSVPIYNRTAGIYNSVNTPTFVNALINTDYYYSVTNYPAPSAYGPNPAYSYCNIRGVYSGGYWATGYGADNGNNMDENTDFFDTTSCNVNLYDSSPEIGTGNGSYGSNIGYYQGTGLIKLAIEPGSDFISCGGDTVFLFRFALRDEASDSASYSINIGIGDLSESNISDTLKNDTIDVSILLSENWYGKDSVSIIISNLSGEYDSTGFIFNLAKKPTLTMYDLGVFNQSDSTYSVVLYEDSTIVGETFFLDGITTGNNYFTGLKAGYHYGLIEKDGCYSDTLDIDLPDYINDIPLEIVSLEDTTIVSVCQIDTTVRFEFKIVDDNLDQVEWSYNGNWYNPIPDSNMTLNETDSSYYFTVNLPSDSSGLYRLAIHAENIYFELANLYFDIVMVEPPIIDSIQIIDYDYDLCVYPYFSNADYWNYSFTFYIDNEISSSFENCGLDYGEHIAVAYHDNCPSNQITFTITEEEEPTDTISTSVNEMEENTEITVYPIPAKDYIYFTGIKSVSVVEIIDNSGRNIKKYYNIRESDPIDITNINPGKYYLLLKTKKGYINKPFVKE